MAHSLVKDTESLPCTKKKGRKVLLSPQGCPAWQLGSVQNHPQAGSSHGLCLGGGFALDTVSSTEAADLKLV